MGLGVLSAHVELFPEGPEVRVDLPLHDISTLLKGAYA